MAVTSVARFDPILVMSQPKKIEPIKDPIQLIDLENKFNFLQNFKQIYFYLKMHEIDSIH